MLLFVPAEKSAFICNPFYLWHYLKSIQLHTTYIELLFVPSEKSASICTHRKKCFYLYPQKKVLLFVYARKSASICTCKKMGLSRDTTPFNHRCADPVQKRFSYNIEHARKACPRQRDKVYTRHCNNTIGAIIHINHLQ